MPIVIGCDPGVAGGIAFLDTTGRAQAFPMPETDRDLWDLLAELKSWGATHAILEEVQPGGLHRSRVADAAAAGGEGGMPRRMGAKSAFTFGRGFGRLEMGLIAAGFIFERVRPPVWQKALQCMTKGDKRISKKKAQELHPSLKVTLKTADALLLAQYGQRYVWPASAMVIA